MYQVFPNVHFEASPFFKSLSQIVQPTTFVTFKDISFKRYEFTLLAQHIKELESDDVQVHLRIGRLNKKDLQKEMHDVLDDNFSIEVNGTVVCNIQKKKPADITELVKKTDEPNVVTITWFESFKTPYVFAVYIVKKLSLGALIEEIKQREAMDSITRTQLSQNQPTEVIPTLFSTSLLCPLTKVKIKLPVRALTCTHIQCFDALSFLQMNEHRPTWLCPICNKTALFKNLVLVPLFMKIIRKTPSQCVEVQFHEDGSWTPVMPTKKSDTPVMPTKKSDATVMPTKKSDATVFSQAIPLGRDTGTMLPPQKKPRPSTNKSTTNLKSPEETQQSQELRIQTTEANQIEEGTLFYQKDCFRGDSRRL